MRISLLSALIAFGKNRQKGHDYPRPLYIVRNVDEKRFDRRPDSTYVNTEDGERLPLYLTQQVLAGEVIGYRISAKEAPDFHAETRPSAGGFILDGHVV